MSSIIVNVIESILLVIFITKFHSLKISKLTVLFIVICFFIQTLFTFNNVEANFAQIAILSVLLYMYQFFIFKKDNQVYFFASQVAVLIIMVSNIVSLFILALMRMSAQEHLYVAIIISKTLSILAVWYFSNKAKPQDDNLFITALNIIIVAIVVFIDVQIRTKLALEASIATYIMIIGLVVMSVVIFVIVDEYLKYEKYKLMSDFESKRADLAIQYSNKVEKVNHAFIYIMMDVLYKARQEKAEKTKQASEKYLSYISTKNYNITTGNPYFDMRISELMLKYIQHGLDVNINILPKAKTRLNQGNLVDDIVVAGIDALKFAKEYGIPNIDIKIEEKDNFILVSFLIDEIGILDPIKDFTVVRKNSKIYLVRKIYYQKVVKRDTNWSNA